MKPLYVMIAIVAVLGAVLAAFVGLPLLRGSPGIPPGDPGPQNGTPEPTPTVPATTPKPPNTVIVASATSDSASRATADYICDGHDDQIEIGQAFEEIAARHGGGTVYLTEGVFNIRGFIRPADSTTLKGAGPNSTNLNFATDGGISISRGSYVTLSSFRFTGKGRVLITTSHNRLEHIQAYRLDNSYMAAFMIYTVNEAVDDIGFYRCQVIDSNRWGFVHSGERQPNTVSNITYLECQAVNCGRYGQYYGEQKQYTEAWDVGFNAGEVLSAAKNVRYINCTAEGCWESGFHVEATTALTNVEYVNCVSRNNGQKYLATGQTDFGAGYLVGRGMTLTDCVSEKNVVGYLCHDTGGTLTGCIDRGSMVGYRILKISDVLRLTGCSAVNSTRPVVVWTGETTHVLIDRMQITSAARQPAAAIYVDPLVMRPGGIIVSNSTIEGYTIGIENRAPERGRVHVRNVSVSGADEDFVFCIVT